VSNSTSFYTAKQWCNAKPEYAERGFRKLEAKNKNKISAKMLIRAFTPSSLRAKI
jgi:hypothetical protein